MFCSPVPCRRTPTQIVLFSYVSSGTTWLALVVAMIV